MALCNTSHNPVFIGLLVFLQITIIFIFAKISMLPSYKHYQPGHKFHRNILENSEKTLKKSSPDSTNIVSHHDKISSSGSTITRQHAVTTSATSTLHHQQTKIASENADSSLSSRNIKLYSSIKNNSVYRNFDILDRGKRESVNLLLIVSTAPKRLDRRNAIRETWWPLCKDNEKVKVRCLFMTDKQNKESKYYQQVNDEVKKYRDLEFQVLGGGVEFGKRYLYQILWAVRNFEFDYLLRLDDDYFVCIDKIINELPMPPLRLFHWGWVHCTNGITRPEESILMLSQDVIKLFLQQDPDKMRCHPWADQMIALWVEDLNLRENLKYRTDRRLHHHPPVREMPNVLSENNICLNRLGLHGSYPETMRTLWQHRGNYELKKETLIDNSNVCQSDLKFRWNAFGGAWQYEPKLCKTNPSWDTSKQGTGSSYGGREEGFNR